MAQTNGQTGNHKKEESLIPTYCWGKEINIDAGTIRENLLEIKQNIAPCKPKIVGVTKYYGRDSIINGYEAGLRDFGESRAVEAAKKIASLPEYIKQNSKFHFIGHLQTNKADIAVSNFDCIQSVDSLKLATAISNSAQKHQVEKEILLQVNNANEEQKFGFSKEELRKDLADILKLPGIKVVGLMNMAPLGASEAALRELFHDMAVFKSKLETEFGIILPELSMGMSDDYKFAVEEGATIIRIGRKLFTK